MKLRIEASNKVIDDDTGIVLIDSFWRHDCLIYMAMRDAGMSHAEVSFHMSKKPRGGGVNPRFYHEDEVELM